MSLKYKTNNLFTFAISYKTIFTWGENTFYTSQLE